MKWTPFRVILLLNLLIIAGIYLMPYGGDSGGYITLIWAMITVLHIGANLVLAALTGLASVVMEPNNGGLKGVPLAFLICAGLVLLISFPLCFAVASIHH